ncbi:MAG: hypothetical protein ABSD52_12690 [Candidatus Cybelea sp.]
MTGSQSLLGPLAAIAVAGLLAGCAGAVSAPPTSSSAPAASQMQSLATPIQPAKCAVDHGVSVNPCSLSLSWSKPKATVKTSGPKGSGFSFSDKTCSAEGIATVAGSGGSYVVTWGTKSGSCSVVFTAKVSGKTVGTAKLSVRNTA